VQQFDRAEALMAADVDLIVIDTAHGHSKNVLDTLEGVKKRFNAAKTCFFQKLTLWKRATTNVPLRPLRRPIHHL
jgi:hypothetical protein